MLGCKLHTSVATSFTSNIVLRIQSINIMLLSCQECFNMIDKLKNNKVKRILPIVVICALQIRVLVLACTQIFKMVLFAFKQILGRANVSLLIDPVDNGINA